MKKLFTTLILMGVTLAGWGTIEQKYDEATKTLTINYQDTGDQNEMNNLNNNYTNATKIVLTGDWTNSHLNKIGYVVGQCQNNVYLDLSACTGMVSKVNFPSSDWTGENYTFSYSNAPAEEKDVIQKSVYYLSNGTALSQYDYVYEREGKYYWNGWDGSSGGEHEVTEKRVWGYEVYGTFYQVDESSVTVDNGDGTGKALVQPQGTAFSLSGGDFDNRTDKLSGIAFPDHENFTAIPDDVFGENGPSNLTEAVVGNYVEFIGKHAFKGSKLTSFNFPTSLKVMGGESFKALLTEVNLASCTQLQKIGYEAFEDCSTVTSVTFPAGSTFTFLGNDAFKGTSITSVDMSMCEGITEFKSKGDDGSTYKTFYNCNKLTTVILPPNLTAIPDDGGNGVFAGSKNIVSLTFTGKGNYVDCVLQNPLTIGDASFAYCRSLATITLSNNVSSIGIEAFNSAAITEIHIPASVEQLKKHSFINCQQLTTVYFDEFDKTCGDCEGANTQVAGAAGSGGQGQGAFQTCQNITDVYINTLADLQCDNNAFDQLVSWGAGNSDGNFATLHFPKEKIEQYVNLTHYLTDEIVTNPGKFHDWLMEHYDQATIPHENGWYEFINSGPSAPEDGPEYQDIILRTFSDYDYAYLVPNGIRAYVVNNIEKKGENYEVSLQRLNVIPKRTGVILYGHPNGKTSDGKPTLVLTPVKFLEKGDPVYKIEDGKQVVDYYYDGPDQGAALCRANWNNLDADHMKYKNYLEPTISADGSSVPLKPYEYVTVDGAKKITFRNFGLGRYTSTDYSHDAPLNSNENNYVGFFRLKDRNYKSGYAYLRLRGDVDETGNALPVTVTEDEKEMTYVSEYDDAEGGEIVVVPDTKLDASSELYPYYYEFKVSDGKPFDAQASVGTTDNPKGWWNKNATPVGFYWNEYSLSWGDRTIQFGTGANEAAKFLGELEDDIDGVVKLVIPANDNAKGGYYTLQGVKVSNPTKGVYISNGKKVVIK